MISIAMLFDPCVHVTSYRDDAEKVACERSRPFVDGKHAVLFMDLDVPVLEVVLFAQELVRVVRGQAHRAVGTGAGLDLLEARALAVLELTREALELRRGRRVH